MNRDDIIRMAREAGFSVGPSRDGPDDVWGVGANLERFAAFVATAEREACAKVASGYDASPWKHDPPAGHVADMVCTSIAAAIRARGQA